MNKPMSPASPDIDLTETEEWIEALHSFVGTGKPEPAEYVVTQLQDRARNRENLRRYFGGDRETINQAALQSCKDA